MIGEEGVKALSDAAVLIVGVGGVGSYAAEALARAGVGRICVMDGDSVAKSNLNRQLIALESTVGQNKAELMAGRIRDINSETDVKAIADFYREGCDLAIEEYDWIVDAIDDVNAKTALIASATEKGVKICSAMGAAGKFGTDFKMGDIAETTVCPLAKVMRKRLREIGIEHLPVAYSTEKPIPREGVLGSISYVPGSMGLVLAGYVIKQITGIEGEHK